MSNPTWHDKDLGPVSAWALAVKDGYTGTKEEWLASFANTKENADRSEKYATGEIGGTDVPETDPAYHNNAEFYADQAAGSATAAAGLAEDANAAKTAAQAAQAAVEQYTAEAIDEWLDEHIDPETGYALDNTLSLSNAAAPANLVGDLKSAISDETYNLWEYEHSFTFTGAKYISPEYGYQINLPAGTYTISAITASESTAHQYNYVAFRNDTTVIGTANIVKGTSRDYKSITIESTCNNIVFYSAGTSSASTGAEGSWTDIMITSGTDKKPYLPNLTATDYVNRLALQENKDRIDNEIAIINNIEGYKKPNLISEKYNASSLGGASFTVNSDRSVTLSGTTSSNSGTNVSVQLPTGKYILNGLNGGSTGTYFYRLVRADSSYKDVTDGEYEFEVTGELELVTLYIRVKSGKTINTTIYPMIRTADIYDGTYAPYGEYAIYKDIQSLIDYTQFNWSGKKMNALGDSIVKGSNGNFINVIGGILHLSTVRNYGIGGSCIASTDIDQDYPPAVTRYVNMDNDAQIIIVHAGTNDYTAQVPIGETNSQDITTWNGALNVLMTGLRAKYPTALIMFSNILDRIQDNNPERYPIVCQTYRDTLEAACRRNHMVFYNGFTELNFDFHQGYYDHILTVDGLHPNQTGANIMGRSIAGFIKWH